MSEAWSLDADPPESVTNEIINDPLDENTSMANLSINSSTLTSSGAATNANSRLNATTTIKTSNLNSNNSLLNFNTEQVFEKVCLIQLCND